MKKLQFTQRQMQDFAAYEEVRVEGRFNMLDPRARSLTGLSRDDYVFVMENYHELSLQFQKEGKGK